jgi:hypothetical protein
LKDSRKDIGKIARDDRKGRNKRRNLNGADEQISDNEED